LVGRVGLVGRLGPVGLVALMVLMLANCGSPKESLPPIAKAQAEEVTLDQLAAAPNKFDGALVRVIGMASIVFESTMLWRPQDGPNRFGDSPAEVQRSNWFRQHAVWLDLPWPVPPETRALNGKPVVVEGRFDRAMKGRVEMLGTLKNIIRIEEASRCSSCPTQHASHDPGGEKEDGEKDRNAYPNLRAF
jgi:hypothetical protein